VITLGQREIDIIYSQTCIQWPPLGPEKSGRLKKGPDKRFKLAVDVSNWPLLTGGRYSQVVVNSGLTVQR
jgi:hypothetical protein